MFLVFLFYSVCVDLPLHLDECFNILSLPKTLDLESEDLSKFQASLVSYIGILGNLISQISVPQS